MTGPRAHLGQQPEADADSARIALITGAGNGIGRAYATALAEDGWIVGVADIDIAAAISVNDQITSQGGRAMPLECDVADPASTDRGASSFAERFGGIDLLVANAGLHLPHWNVAPTRLDPDDWHRLLAVNVIGVVNSARSCRPHMTGRSGVVVVQGSVAAQRPTTAYGVSKLAVRGVTHALAHEFADDGARVVGIMPGPMPTESVLAEVPSERLDQLAQAQLVRRRGSVEDLIAVLRFLVSADAAFITGESISVSGGLWTQV